MGPTSFHRQQYVIASILCLAFGIMYFFAPSDRADALLGLATAAAGFCFGKFSNGFNRSRRPPHTSHLPHKEGANNGENRVHSGRR